LKLTHQNWLLMIEPSGI